VAASSPESQAHKTKPASVKFCSVFLGVGFVQVDHRQDMHGPMHAFVCLTQKMGLQDSWAKPNDGGKNNRPRK
jgi:hypothetical protein